jgi:aryl-alcohol dehydrogenase-like predicted oxidoreductase
MEKRAFGRSGLTVSALGFGAGHIGGAELSDADVDSLLGGALDLGITLFDTAPSYGAGEARLQRFLSANRHRVQISTKGGYGVPGVPDWTYETIVQGLDLALGRLGVDTVDVFHLHSCPLDVLQRGEVIAALERCRAAGKLRVAAYSGENDALAFAIAQPVFGSVQCSINLADQRSLRVHVPDAVARGMGVIAKRPIANAAWRHPERPRGDYGEVYWERLRTMDLASGSSGFFDTALRFSAFAPGVSSAILGTRSLTHLAEAARIVARGPLDPQDSAHIGQAFEAHGANWHGEI